MKNLKLMEIYFSDVNILIFELQFCTSSCFALSALSTKWDSVSKEIFLFEFLIYQDEITK